MFVVVLLSTVLDFWAVKNVTARYLIGLRWWSSSDISSDEDLDDQTEKAEDEDEGHGWYFESYNYDVSNSIMDTNIFWFSQLGVTIFWSIFLFLYVIGISLFWVRLTQAGHAGFHLRLAFINELLRLLQSLL